MCSALFCLLYDHSYRIDMFHFLLFYRGIALALRQADGYPSISAQPSKIWKSTSPRTHDVMTTSSWGQNDITTSFWRCSSVIIMMCVRRVVIYHKQQGINIVHDIWDIFGTSTINLSLINLVHPRDLIRNYYVPVSMKWSSVRHMANGQTNDSSESRFVYLYWNKTSHVIG